MFHSKGGDNAGGIIGRRNISRSDALAALSILELHRLASACL